MRLGSSPGAFLNIFGAPGSVSQALLAGPGRPKSALGAPWARSWRPKHRAKSRPRVIVAALIVRDRFGDDFRTIFDDVRSIFGRFWGPSMVWFVMLLSGLCRWVVVCQSQPQSTLTHADTSLFLTHGLDPLGLPFPVPSFSCYRQLPPSDLMITSPHAHMMILSYGHTVI